MSNLSRFIDERIKNSITSENVDSSALVDAYQPLSFIEWIENERAVFTSISDLLLRYNSYITNWYEVKNILPEARQDVIVDLYKSLVKEIILNYTTTNERRFLKNIDYSNSSDLAIAIPFFSQKLKDICIYFSTLRDRAKTAVTEYNLKGSNYGVEKLIYNEISKALETQDLTDLIKTYNLSISSIRDDLIVELEELFDIYPNYYDLGTLPTSSYEATGLREQFFNTNTFQLDPDLYLNFDKSIIRAISSYPFFLVELGTNNFTVVPEISASQLEYLKDLDFINLVNNQDKNNLKLNLISDFNKKFIGTDFFYISTNSSNYALTGKLFDADSRFANYLNKLSPTLLFVPEESELKRAQNIGLFFKPDKIGLLNFFNFDFFPVLNTSILSTDTIYIFPDPNKFGNISGNTKQINKIPLNYVENNSILQYDFSNSYEFGDIKSDSLVPTFRSYQSREQSLDISNNGLARYSDPQEFFAGDLKDKWANEDVYPLIPSNLYPIDERISDFNPTLKTLVQFKADVYGNSYGLYKYIEPNYNLNGILSSAEFADENKICLILDGYSMYDLISGYNFNYSLSGTILRSINQIPPGSGYYTRLPLLTAISPLSASRYNNGIPEFELQGEFFNILSYRFQPEKFCSEYVNIFLNCNLKDGITFVSPTSGPWPDFPSDDIGFDSLKTVYYNDLLDGAASPTSPNYIASFSNPGSFLFEPPLSAITLQDCSYFVVSSFTNSITPCNDSVDSEEGFTENNFFVNLTLPLRNTSYLPTVSSSITKKQTIYKTKYINTGSLYFRSSDNNKILPIYNVLSANFIKYPLSIQSEIQDNKIINFDIFYDTLHIETQNYLIFDKIEFNYVTNKPKSSTSSASFISKGNHNLFEKFSTLWFDEKLNQVFFATTNLFYYLSATNFKIIYPTIYVLDVATTSIKQIYPFKNASNLTYTELKDFSLSGTGYSIDIVEIDKPIFSYSSESDSFNISYLAKDVSGLPYINEIRFKYFNGVLSNVNNYFFKPKIENMHLNFSNPSSFNDYNTYSVLGSSAGVVINGEFVFGV